MPVRRIEFLGIRSYSGKAEPARPYVLQSLGFHRLGFAKLEEILGYRQTMLVQRAPSLPEGEMLESP